MTSAPESSITQLLDIMARLRGPDGCPWDREQTLDSLKPFLVEETYEVLEALDSGNRSALREELGDLLLQIVFQCQLCSETGDFQFEDVVSSISQKLIRRHPHVFGDVEARDTRDVLKNWDAIKKAEKGGGAGSSIDGIPRSLPALAKAREVQKRVSRSGFDWLDAAPVKEKVKEEWAELEVAIESGDTGHIREEFGDLLFSMVNLSRFLDLDAEDVLRSSVDKFSRRFRAVEALAEANQQNLQDCTPQELERFWEQVKADEFEA